MKPRPDETLHGYEYPLDTRTQIALVGQRVEYVEKRLSQQDDLLERLDHKLDTLLLESAKRRSDPPAKTPSVSDGLKIHASGKALATLATVATGLGVAVAKLIEFLGK